MPLLYGSLFPDGGSGRNTARTSVEAGAVIHHRSIVDHDGTVDISVVHYRGVYIHDGRIIPESTTFPSSPSKSGASVSISIVHAAVEADMWPPIAGVPSINTA
jgi:hypothetical protein